ncbi:MAG: hypothetical protein ABIP51_11690 [Bacteroidia bacterium]
MTEKDLYKAEGKRRIQIRQNNRKQKWSDRVKKYGRGSKQCKECGSYMYWCSCCEVWSKHCCGNDYGTCQCS